MGKSDAIIESIVRKIEKTAMELSAMAGKKTELTVGGGKFCFFRYHVSIYQIFSSGLPAITLFLQFSSPCSALYSTVCMGLCKVSKSPTLERTCKSHLWRR